MTDPATEAASTATLRRRHRDEPTRGPASSSLEQALNAINNKVPAATPTSAPSPGSIEAVIAGGHRWLRFPAALEREFQRETQAPHRRLVIATALLGMLGFWIGSANDALIAPDVAPEVLRNARYGGLLLLLAGFLPFASTSLRRRPWWTDAPMTYGALVIVALLIALGRSSESTAAYVHTAGIATVLVYASIAARQRFWHAVTLSLVAFVGYATLVHGHTPIGQVIVAANLRLIGATAAFVLIANYALEHAQRRGWLLRRLSERRGSALAMANERLRVLSRVDTLTGLYNRRQLDDEVAQTWAEAIDRQRALALLLLDIDHFKAFNDSYGLPAGDVALQQVSRVLQAHAQSHGGVAARLGGEEFALLLPGRDEDEAREIAEALRAAIAALALPHRASPTAAHLTVSIGVACARPQPGDGAAGLFDGADDAMYMAKNDGRNRVEVGEVIDMPMLDAPPTAAATAPPGQAQLPLQDVLQTGHRWLRFKPVVEASYHAAQAVERRRSLVLSGVAGMLFFNLYVLASRDMVPDAMQAVWYVQVTASVLFAVLTAVLFLPMRWWVRELLFTLVTTLTALGSFAALSQSQMLTLYSQAMVLCLVPMFAGVAARLPFQFTTITAFGTLAGSVFLLRGHSPETQLMALDSTLLIAHAVICTLIASYTLEHGQRLAWVLSSLARIQLAELVVTTQRLRALSILDPLTGIPNRRAFELDMKRAWAAAADAPDEPPPVSLLFIDVDYFKLYNDTMGHPAGDKCLRQVGVLLAETAAADNAPAFRIGGEEFAVLLPGRTQDEAKRIAQGLCMAVRGARFPHPQSPMRQRVTISLGVATIVPRSDADRKQLLTEADAALYAAKAAGKDRISVTPRPQPRS